MPIVTITSDLGNDSYALAALKGALYSKCSNITQIIDISNTIRNYDIVEAAFVFSNAYRYFPKNTVHILSINPFYGAQYQMLLLKAFDQYFIAPNNGILPLIFEHPGEGQVVSLEKVENTAQYYTKLGETVNRLRESETIEMLGTPVPELHLKISLQPVVSKDIIRGTIIHIDRFGNLISNIKKTTFEKVRGDRNFAIYFRHKDPITKINAYYHEVPVGDELCTFNMTEHLEIAVNMGNASEILGVQLDDTIQIDFQ